MTDATSTDDDAPTVDVPRVVRRDEAFAPTVAGAAPGQRVTVTVETDDEEPWSASATFEADEDGVVDLARDAPVEGDHERADPMGLVWSLTPPGTDSPDHRYRMNPLGSHELQFTAKAGDAAVTGSVTVRHSAPGVAAHDPGDDGPFGTWYEPPGEGPHPPVVVLHGSGGHVMDATAGLLASEGFAALALRWLGAGDLPETPRGVPLSYVEDAVDWFLARDAVAGDTYGACGVSMGAQLALVLASRDDRVAAVVSDSGNHLCYETGDGGAWADDGEDLPRVGVPDAPPDAWDRPVGEDAVDRSGMWLGMLAAESTDRRRAATLPVEDGDAALCLLSGGDDAQWPAGTFHRMLLARLDALGYEPRTEHHWYQDAGHAIGAPHVPTTWRPAAGEGLASGGDPAAHAAAQADAWPQVLSFLEAELGD
jgi:dienelactone hydrolase